MEDLKAAEELYSAPKFNRLLVSAFSRLARCRIIARTLYALSACDPPFPVQRVKPIFDHV
jgi:hypothetical protein